MKKEKFYVVIAGGREFHDYLLLEKAMDYYLSQKLKDPQFEVVIVHGAAKGADELGGQYATKRNLKCIEFPISQKDWKMFKGSAGSVRNNKMAEIADVAVVFWNGESTGSKNMIEQMQRRNKRVVVVHYLELESSLGANKKFIMKKQLNEISLKVNGSDNDVAKEKLIDLLISIAEMMKEDREVMEYVLKKSMKEIKESGDDNQIRFMEELFILFQIEEWRE